MKEMFQPLSFWVQMESLAFMLSGVHGEDLLVIRFFLFLAYVMLFVNAALGSPLWPDASTSGLALDSFFWSLLGMYVHGSSLVGLILDERKVDLSNDEAALWRMFYRTGGLSSHLFKQIVADNMQVVQYRAGDSIPTDDYFYILYKGPVNLKVYEDHSLLVNRYVRSGEIYLGMFQEGSFFCSHKIHCISTNHTKLFQFSREHMTKIAHHRYAKGIWQTLLCPLL